MAVGVVVALAFWSGTGHEFLNWDDEQNIVRNSALRLPWPDYFTWAWSARLLAVYQPLAWLFLGVLSGPLGPTATVVHTASILLHAAVAMLLFATLLLAHRVLGGSEPVRWTGLAAALATLWFALHPLRVEAVAWASCQPYLLASGFALLSYRAFLRSLELESTGQAAARRWSLAWYLAAVLSKASVFALPALLFVTRAWCRVRQGPKLSPRELARLALRDWPYWLLAVAAVGMAVGSRELVDSSAHHGQVSALVRALQPLVTIAYAVALTVLPVHLSPLHPLPHAGWTAGCSILVAGLGGWLALRGPAPARFLALGTAVLLVPGIGSAMTETIAFADRVTYLPAMVLAFGVSMWLDAGLRTARRGWLLPLGAAVLAFGAWGTTGYLSVWHDSTRLWQHAIATGAGESVQALSNLATACLDRGDFPAACQVFERARRLDPDLPEVLNGTGLCALQSGDLARAEAAFRRAIQVKPAYAEACSNLAFVLSQQGALEPALHQIETALRLSPDTGKMHEMRARVLEKLGRYPEAVEEWRRVLASNPEDGEAYLLAGAAMAQEGDLESAARTLSSAVERMPGNAAARSALERVRELLQKRPAR